MASFLVHIVGKNHPVSIDVSLDDLDALAMEASRAKFLIGHMTNADEDGVYRRVMISTNRIECVVEA